MKCELENLKPQQYPGQHITDMSLDVTDHCQALTTAGICNRLLQQMNPQMGNNLAGQQVNDNNKAKTK